MISTPPIQLTVGDPHNFLRDLKQEIKDKWKGQVHYHNNRLSVQSAIWDGAFRDFAIDEGLSITFVNLAVKQPCQVYHESSDQEFHYHFYFDRALGQRLHAIGEEDGTPIGIAEKNSYIVMSSNTRAHTDMPVCEIDNIIVHMSRKFFTDNVPMENLQVDAAVWQRLFGLRPLVLYGACNDKILKVVDDLSHIELPDYALAIYLKGSVLQLISQVLQIEIEKRHGDVVGIANLKDVRALLDINFEIEQHFDDPLPTIDEVAAKVHMSATKFKELFKKTFGGSYYAYYKQRRMHKARELLLTKKYSVAEVAGMVGFLNSGKFSKQFKTAYDVLPKDLLKTTDDVDWKHIDAQLKNQHFRISYQ